MFPSLLQISVYFNQYSKILKSELEICFLTFRVRIRATNKSQQWMELYNLLRANRLEILQKFFRIIIIIIIIMIMAIC